MGGGKLWSEGGTGEGAGGGAREALPLPWLAAATPCQASFFPFFFFFLSSACSPSSGGESASSFLPSRCWSAAAPRPHIKIVFFPAGWRAAGGSEGGAVAAGAQVGAGLGAGPAEAVRRGARCARRRAGGAGVGVEWGVAGGGRTAVRGCCSSVALRAGKPGTFWRFCRRVARQGRLPFLAGPLPIWHTRLTRLSLDSCVARLPCPARQVYPLCG